MALMRLGARLACTLLLLAVAAFADPLDIDFRASSWNGAEPNPSFTVNYGSLGDVTATALPSGSKLFQDNTDGLGILGGEPDEVDGQEILEITFSNPLTLVSMLITDLFLPADGGGVGEKGTAIFYNSANGLLGTINFDAVQGNGTNGELTQAINLAGVSRVQFLPRGTAGNNEFSVAGFNAVLTPPVTEPIPEPSTLLLMGAGLLAVGVARRRLVRS